MPIGSFLYMIFMSVGECWFGILLYIIAIKNKSRTLFWIGCILQNFLNISNLTQASIHGYYNDIWLTISFIVMLLFWFFTVIAFKKSKNKLTNDHMNDVETKEERPYTIEKRKKCPHCNKYLKNTERTDCEICGSPLITVNCKVYKKETENLY